ncbi:MAG: hypothetical protein JJV98_14165, partial [Desulfosarcina sp.]|nr:hypothetical protein [Desulfobacterales bacterium]
MPIRKYARHKLKMKHSSASQFTDAYNGHLTRRWLCLAFFIPVLFIFAPFELWAGEADRDRILYLQSGDAAFEATLIPNRPTGAVAIDPGLVKTTTDGRAIALQVSAGEEGNSLVNGTFPDLPDGRHNASVETFSLEGIPLDRSELLFYVDTKPPLIELIQPEGRFPRESRLLVFKITDPENGSGVDADIQMSGLNVDISDAWVSGRNLVFINNELHLLLHLGFPDGFIRHSAQLRVSVSIRDRAGNVGTFQQTFATRDLLEPEFHFYRCGGISYVETAAEFLVYPRPQALTLSAGKNVDLDLVTLGYNGKDYQYPPRVEKDLGRSREINWIAPFFQEAVGKRIEITNASGNISIQKLPDADLEDSRIRFSILQNRPVAMGHQVDFIEIRYPVSIRIEKNTDFCRAGAMAAANGQNDNIYDHIPENKISFDYETLIYPVVLEVADSPFRLNLYTEKESLIAEVGFNPIELMDSEASWFEVDGARHWFDCRGEIYRSGALVQEGLVHYKIAMAGRIGAYRDASTADNGRTLFQEGDYLIRRTPPEIINFHYDRSVNAAKARIADNGTLLENLRVRLHVPGLKEAFEFDTHTGQFTATLPFIPMSVLTATLSITDQADQTTTARCAIFGEPQTDKSRYRPQVAADSAYRGSVPYTPDIKRKIGFRHGRTLVEICEKYKQFGYYIGTRFVPLVGGADSVSLVQLQERKPSSSKLNRIRNRKDLDIKLFHGRYDQSKYMAGRFPGVSSKLMLTGSHSKPSQTIYYLLGYRDGNDFVPVDPGISSLAGLRLSHRISENCTVKELDLSPPVIAASYDTNTGRVTATIHDPGMPFDQLQIDFFGQADHDKSNAYYRGNLPFLF